MSTPRTLMLLQVPLGLDSCEGPACKRAKLASGEHEVDLDMASMCLPLLGRSWCASSPDTVAQAVAAEVGLFWSAAAHSALWCAENLCTRGCGCRSGGIWYAAPHVALRCAENSACGALVAKVGVLWFATMFSHPWRLGAFLLHSCWHTALQAGR